LECLLCAGEATGDEVRDVVELPPGIALNCFGGVPGPLAKAGVIRRARYEPTCRPAGRGRPITVWQLADRAAAKRWLYDHPDRPDGDAGSQGVILFSIDPNEPTPSAAADGVGSFGSIEKRITPCEPASPSGRSG